jgi:hypothetical protein
MSDASDFSVTPPELRHFFAMAECGRQKRLAECVPNSTCSSEGNMFMEYIDTLAEMPLVPLGTHVLRGIASPCAVFTLPHS